MRQGTAMAEGMRATVSTPCYANACMPEPQIGSTHLDALGFLSRQALLLGALLALTLSLHATRVPSVP